MATGSLKTPAILQQSGIGPASVLSSAGVTQVVDLPVGLNLIDQTTTTTDWSFKGPRGGGQPITFPRFEVSRRPMLSRQSSLFALSIFGLAIADAF